MEKKEILAYKPGEKFPPISITARFCKLDCAHCGGRYLRHMLPATSPEALVSLCQNLWENRRTGVLISGGCDIGGTVPLGPFIDAIREVKETTGLLVNVHTGLLDVDTAESLVSAGVDLVSFDLVGSKATINGIYGIDRGTEDYGLSLDILEKAGLEVIPHICIGLDHGQIVGERNALRMAVGRKIKALVFIVLVPTRGTRMARDVPPTPDEVKGIISEARNLMPNIRILLGCMRPRGPEMEMAALEAGADGIVLPSKATRDWLKSQGIEVLDLEACCVVPPEML